ncbi:MAG TPA: phenylalanine--tRNA ligase subunit beta [Acidobacteriaceae bacterium]|jgi:phenylalanyl-tRNA synthetase beta chain|nr:phenylalanine--tRNA ligase subunit beta [Acidobacteriaceae bacterium]
MDILTTWLRSFLPELPVDDEQLAGDLTLRGIAVEGIFPVAGGGSRFEMDITTNRVDAMNHYGVAREAAAIYGVPLRKLADGIAAPVETQIQGPAFPVRIEAQNLCGRFTARVLRGVTVGLATGRMAEYFAALGQKPISAPVDATNFGWLAMGQPTHVFDLDTIEGGIVVRRARAGERLRLLDGTEKALSVDDLVIADERKALSLAGVMGGWESRVTETTKNILVESAWFEPAAIRASSRRHGLHTDASHRYERGADFNAAPVANHLVARLVLEQAGGQVVGPMVDAVVPELEAKTAGRERIVLRVEEVQRILGTTQEDALMDTGQHVSALSDAVVGQVLTALGCGLEPMREEGSASSGEYAVTLPSWRLDLEREIDLIEEVARVYGYNRFADTLPSWAGAVVKQPHAEQELAIREILRALGYSEAISSTFLSAEEAVVFADEQAGAVAIGNPLSEEAGILRPSLAAGMASMLAQNLHRDVETVRLFEMGTVFTGSSAEVREATGLVLGATGGAGASALHLNEDALVFEVKGALERLLQRFSGGVSFEAAGLPRWIASGRGGRALLDGHPVAVFGELSAAELGRRKLRQRCVVAEVQAEVLLNRALRQPMTRELSRFQAVERDFSFVFRDSVRWQAVEQAVRALGVVGLRNVEPVEIFRDTTGKAVAADSYSVLVRVVFQSDERTLTEEELSLWGVRVVEALRVLGGSQRT